MNDALQNLAAATRRTPPTVVGPARKLRFAGYFALACLVGLLLMLAPLLYFFRHFETQALQDRETQRNIAITHSFTTQLWPSYVAYVQGASRLGQPQLAQSPQASSLRRDVLQQMLGLSLVEVRLYDLHGLTVFSTDTRQIGQDRSGEAGVQAAIAGQVLSQMRLGSQAGSTDKEVRDLVTSYLPIRRSADQAPQGVLELSSDVSEDMALLGLRTQQISVVVCGSLVDSQLDLWTTAG